MFPDEPTDEEKLEELPEDGETPFRPADEINQPVIEPSDDDTVITLDDTIATQDAGTLDDTYPQTDTNIQAEEEYDEGVSGAAEAGEPNANNAVIGYIKPLKDA